MKIMRSDLGRVRGSGAAHDGTTHFWMQRLTAISNLPLVVFMLWFVIAHLGAERAGVVASLKNPFVAVAMVLAFLSVLWHMRLGLQIVIEDYVHTPLTKISLLILNSFYAVTLGAMALYAILKMSFGL